MHLTFPALIACLVMTACAPFPEVAAQNPETGPPPALLPIDELLAQAEFGPPAAPGP